MKTTSNSFIPLQVKQVTSLLHDRQQCATVAGIAQDLSLSRTAASELLQTIASNETSASWQATLCQTHENSEGHGDEEIPCAGR